MSLLSAPGSVLIKITLTRSLRSGALRLCFCQNKYGQQSLADGEMLRWSKFSEPINV